MRIIVNCADTLYKRVFPNSRQVELLDDIPAFELLGGWDLRICGFLYVVIGFLYPPGDLWLKSATKIPMEIPWNQSHQFTEIPWNPHELSAFSFFFEIRKFPMEVMEVPNFRSNLRDPNTNRQAPATTTSTWKPVRPRVSLPGGPTLKRKSWDSWDMNYLLGIFLFYKFVWEIYFVIIYIFVWDIIGIWLDLIYIYIYMM